LEAQLGVAANVGEKLEVKHIEACGVVLTDLNLLEHGFANCIDWQVVVLEQICEVSQHYLSNVHFPVKLSQQKSQGPEQHSCCLVLLLLERV
jgi:hypothetical protein